MERNSKEVKLTPAGKVFLRQARHLIGQLEMTTELVRDVADGASGAVRIGFTPAMVFRGLPEVLSEFQHRHPGITLHLREQNSAAQIEALNFGRIDIGFIHAIPLPAGIGSFVIASEEFVCCLPSHHPLATRRTLELGELASEPLVMFDRELAPHYYDRIVALLRVADVEPLVRHEVSHWLTIIALIAHGMGVSLVPRALAASGFANVAFVPLKHSETRHESRCIWRLDGTDIGRDLLLDCARERFASEPATASG